ncbi:MAG TPA: hypothetical protein VHC21_04090 [Candidatus Saccharimonadales bacterium]|nr:hypothetical protein [Candidatus Saccharimonadales bacterium]
MKTFEDFGMAVGDAPQSPATGDAVELAVTTYNDLGLLTDEGKAREAFGEAVETFAATLPESVTSQPYDIVMVPKLGELSLGDLIGRYDQLTGQKGNPSTYVWSGLWDKYSDTEFNQGQTVDIEPRAVLLGGENDYDEAGLYFTNQNLKAQRKSLKEAQKNHDSNETTLGSLSVAGYMVRNAMQLERGEQLMDRPTFTRFIELDKKRADDFSYVPSADSFDGGQVHLRRSYEVARSHGGVRLSVGPKA